MQATSAPSVHTSASETSLDNIMTAPRADPASVAQSAPFFKLSGELRNNIYRLAIVESPAIEVTADGFSKSGLLGTCKEIRNEAYKISYQDNTFHHVIEKFDAQVLAKYGALRSVVTAHGKLEVFLSTSLRWEPCWEDLLEWLKMLHAGRVPGRVECGRWFDKLKERGETGEDYYLVGAMFETVRRMHNQP